MNRPNVDREVLAKRAARFGSAPAHPSTRNRNKNGAIRRSQDAQNVQNSPEVDDFDQKLVGTCEMLEKCYLRLTATPKESDVRPQHVLVKSLDRVKELWDEGCGYQRASELLKSIRQDMTVQGIRDSLSIDVYETNARLALLSKDPAEFNVCLSMLESLYKELPSNSDLRHEFKACRILYYLYTRDLCDLTSLLGTVLSEREALSVDKHSSVDVAVESDVTVAPTEERHVHVDHAIDAAIAWFLGFRHRLLQLYKTAPSLSSLVMDLFVERERRAYFGVIVTAYRPNVPTDFVSSELALDEQETFSFLANVGAVFTDSTRTKIDCKKTLACCLDPNRH